MKANSKILIFSLCVLTILLAGVGCEKEEPTSPTSNFANKTTDQLRPEAIRIIQMFLDDSDPRVRVNAIEVVADTELVDLMPQVQKLLNDPYVPVRFSAALAIGDMNYNFAKKYVRKLLRDPDENVKIAAIYAMAKINYSSNTRIFGAKKAGLEYVQRFKPINDALESPNQTLRSNAALILGKSGNKGAIKLLYKTMIDASSSDKVNLQAAESRAMLKDEKIFAKLWARLISVYSDDKVIGIKGMGSLGTEAAKKALVTMLEDPVVEVRLAAARQLGKLGDNSGEAKIIEVFKKNLTSNMDKQSSERIFVFTALAIGENCSKKTSKYLPKLLEYDSKSVNLSAAKAIIQCTKGV